MRLRLAAPSAGHPFGLDELGRDILARVLAGARISFLVAMVVVSVSSIVGTLLGAVAGYFGGLLDEVISRVTDTLLAFPGMLLAIALVAVLGPSLRQRAVRADDHRLGRLRAAGARPGPARARVRVRPAPRRRSGRRHARVLLRHIIPTALPAVVVQATLGMAGAILGEAALSFLGLGVQPPTPSWGTMLNGGRAHLLDAPHLTLFPGLAMALLVLGFNFWATGCAIWPIRKGQALSAGCLTSLQRVPDLICTARASATSGRAAQRCAGSFSSPRSTQDGWPSPRSFSFSDSVGDAPHGPLRQSIVVAHERAVLEERLARRVEVVLLFGRVGIVAGRRPARQDSARSPAAGRARPDRRGRFRAAPGHRA